MSNSQAAQLPTVTIIIAARPEEAEPDSLRAARKLDYPHDLLEILVARGRQPSVQRNHAARVAKGELIYFLDDDSVPGPDCLRLAVKEFADPKVAMVGGPNLCPADAPPLEQAFALVMGAPLAFWSSSARYRRVGEVRATSEKELILCNMLVRRQTFLDLGGFDEALYPNEENALMDTLQKRGSKLIYHPQIVVYRRPRRTLPAFVRMLRNYGRGRAEQFRLHPTPGSILNFAPPLFLIYLLLAPWLPKLFLVPLSFYGAAVLIQTVMLAREGWGRLGGSLALPGVVARVPALLFMSHIFYGVGIWQGLFTRLGPQPGRPAPEVKLERILIGSAPP